MEKIGPNGPPNDVRLEKCLGQFSGRRRPLGQRGADLRSGPEPQLLEDPPDVSSDRVLGDGEFRGDLAVGETPCHQDRYLPLAAGEGERRLGYGGVL
jgi:hypothetical protein